MVITSKSNRKVRRYLGNSHFRYALIYVCITFGVLLFLNVYTSGTSQMLFYQSKEAAMIEKCQLISAEIAELEVLSTSTVAESVAKIDSIKGSRLIVTDRYGTAVYDSLEHNSTQGNFVLLPEVLRAMEGTGNNVFTSHYQNGAIQSKAASPIVSYGSITGCVYMMEYDTQQGTLIQSLQQNTLTITLFLEIVVIIFSIAFSNTFSRRLRQILSSIRIIREGDYSHKLTMGGYDELTSLADEFNDLTEKLQRSENKRSQFVSDASHELKTPLASIKLLSDSIMQNDMDMPTVKEFVGDIGNEADRLNRMTQKLLALTKIESQQDGECEIIPMGPTVHRAVRMLSGIAEENNISIELQLENDSTILILEDDLYHIVFNLVENGIRYNVPGGKLTIQLLLEQDTSVLRVADTGMGIPQEALSHVFERFYRVDKARSRNSGGSGLGLAIVRNMVERNNGTIQVESTVGVGTVFTVAFPTFDTLEEETE